MAEEKNIEKIEIPGQNWHIILYHQTDYAMVLRIEKNNPHETFKDEELKIIKEDLKDWGKWRKFKELKKDLEK